MVGNYTQVIKNTNLKSNVSAFDYLDVSFINFGLIGYSDNLDRNFGLIGHNG